MRNSLHLVTLVAVSLLASLSPALAETGPLMAVGPSGTIMKLHGGVYGELFPDASETEPGNNVLALDIMGPAGTERLLVPETSSQDAESIFALYFEKGSGLTYLLWEGLINGVHPFLNLVSFDGIQWSDVIPIAGSVYANKGSAQLIILPDNDFKSKASSVENFPSSRTTIYVAWQEDGPAGGEDFLVPIILEDGRYIGWHRVFDLSKLREGGIPSSSKALDLRSVMDPNLQDMLRVQPSARGGAIVVGFISHSTGKFVTLEFEMLPLAWSIMTERVKDLISQNAETSSTIEDLVTRVQDAILEVGADFHPSILEYLANQIRDLLEQHSVTSAVAPHVLEKAGIMMLDIGARVRRKGLVDLEPLGIFPLGRTPTNDDFFHYLKVSLVAERDAPEVEGPATLFLSRTGDHALVVWTVESVVYYRETEGDIWGETQRVELRKGLSQDDVYRILSERTMNR